jgi:anti-sigma regulatory factor (Ser/Thr protein kinase)
VSADARLFGAEPTGDLVHNPFARALGLASARFTGDDSARGPRFPLRRRTHLAVAAMTAHGAPGAVFDGRAGGAVAIGLLAAEAVGVADEALARGKIWDEAACSLRGRPESVRLARDFARETLAAWGLPELCDDVTWVISELVTNALNHGLPHSSRTRWARPIRLCLTMQLAHVLCMVSDPGGGAPVLRQPDYLRESGRGLQVVEGCSERWGWNPLDGGGKVIWAAFRVRT